MDLECPDIDSIDIDLSILGSQSITYNELKYDIYVKLPELHLNTTSQNWTLIW